ncbi:hypothetical protein ACWDBD_41970 [Streptomyces sp. NPDC001118]
MSLAFPTGRERERTAGLCRSTVAGPARGGKEQLARPVPVETNGADCLVREREFAVNEVRARSAVGTLPR